MARASPFSSLRSRRMMHGKASGIVISVMKLDILCRGWLCVEGEERGAPGNALGHLYELLKLVLTRR